MGSNELCLDLPCPECGAMADEKCLMSNGVATDMVHVERVQDCFRCWTDARRSPSPESSPPGEAPAACTNCYHPAHVDECDFERRYSGRCGCKLSSEKEPGSR